MVTLRNSATSPMLVMIEVDLLRDLTVRKTRIAAEFCLTINERFWGREAHSIAK